MISTARTLSLLALMAASGLAQAAWPDKPIKLVVPYPAGGSVDMIARQYAEYLGQALKQPVVIENKGGASTNIGTGYASKARPDGYTILLATESLSNNAALGPAPSFDVVHDLQPVSMLARIPSLIAAHPGFAANDARQLVSLTQVEPGKYSIGSASLFLQYARVEQATGVTLTHVPYKGGAQAASDAMGNQVNMVLASIPVLHPLVTSGKLKPIAISGDVRSKSLPEVPTFKEQGFEEAVFSSWYAIFTPKGVPAEIVAKLNAATRSFVQNPGLKDKLEGIGYVLEASQPEELREVVKKDIQIAQKFMSLNTAAVTK